MASTVFLQELEGTEIFGLAPHLRPADRTEIALTSGRRPLQALTHAVDASLTTRAIVVDGTVAGVTGLALAHMPQDQAPVGVPWLLGSSDLFRISPRDWVSLGRAEVTRWLLMTPRLRNYVHAQNRVSCRWLAHLGFTLYPPQPFGQRNALFHRFEMGSADRKPDFIGKDRT